MAKGWHGVDLDGTLAHYDGWKGVEHIGKPIPAMVKLVKDLLKAGEEVRIFTARVSAPNSAEAKKHIDAWARQHIGTALPITNVKDFGMIHLYDDRCTQVEQNTGRLVGKKKETK